MESASYNKFSIASHTLQQMVEACDIILEWNTDVVDINDYVSSPNGMQKMAASCMLIETIGEAAKKLDKLQPDFLTSNSPEINWKGIKGLRDRIAHGYFKLDAEIILDVVKNEIPNLKSALLKLRNNLNSIVD